MKFSDQGSDTFPGCSVMEMRMGPLCRVISDACSYEEEDQTAIEIARCSITEESVSILSDKLRGQAIIQMNPSQTLQVVLERRFPVASLP
jgi:hypothetical protein